MKNRNIGYLIIGIALLMVFVIFSFNKALTDIVSTACPHGPTCPMWGTISFQTNVSIGITVFVALIGLYLIFFAKEEKIIKKIIRPQVEVKEIKKQNFEKLLKTLAKDEKQIMEKIIESEGTIFQSELVEKTGFSKVKVTRLLDKLEGKGLIERMRRGMTNVIILKH
jgi:uncharacterized membrane protein (DUF106 family)